MPFAGIGCGCKDIDLQGCRREFKEKPQLLQDYKNTENSKIIQNPVMDVLCHFGRVGGSGMSFAIPAKQKIFKISNMAQQKGKIGVTTENIFPVIKKFLYSDHEIFLREIVFGP